MSNKNEIQVGLHISCWNGVPGRRVVSKSWMMWEGVWNTLVLGEFAFLYESIWSPKQKSIFPILLCQGSSPPMEEKIWTMERRYCSMERFLMGFPPSDRSLVYKHPEKSGVTGRGCQLLRCRVRLSSSRITCAIFSRRRFLYCICM